MRAKMRDDKPRERKFGRVKPGDKVVYGAIETEFIHMNHRVAGACALAINTPVGTIFHTGDFKFDQTPIDGAPADFAAIARVGREGVLCMLSDSTNAERRATPLRSASWVKRSPIFSRGPRGESSSRRLRRTCRASSRPSIRPCSFGRRSLSWAGRCRTSCTSQANCGYLKIPPEVVVKIEDIDSYPAQRDRGDDHGLAGRTDVDPLAPVGARSPQDEDHRRATPW